MAEFPAKAFSATPEDDSRPEGAESLAADVLIEHASSSSSKTRSSDIGRLSTEAAGMHEDFHGVSAHASTVEDAALQSQDRRVCPQTTRFEGACSVDRQEEVVTNDNGSGHGVSELLLQRGFNLRIDTTLLEMDQDDRPETPESILVVKEPVVDETTKTAAPKDEHGHYTLEFKREVVEYALRLPAAARVKPTCRAYAASGVSKDAVTLWLRDAESGATPRPRFTHSCKQCPRTGPCKQGAGCNAGSGAASQQCQCEHGHQRHACRRGLCPARQLNAKASYGYHTDERSPLCSTADQARARACIGPKGTREAAGQWVDRPERRSIT